MPIKPMYISLSEISNTQTIVMTFIQEWIKNQKTPVPHKQILINMKANGIGNPTIVLALQTLLKKGYIRRAVMISNKTYYVQIRRI